MIQPTELRKNASREDREHLLALLTSDPVEAEAASLLEAVEQITPLVRTSPAAPTGCGGSANPRTSGSARTRSHTRSTRRSSARPRCVQSTPSTSSPAGWSTALARRT